MLKMGGRVDPHLALMSELMCLNMLLDIHSNFLSSSEPGKQY